HIDWIMFSAAFVLVVFGLVTMNSFSGSNIFFQRQVVWLLLSVIVFFGASFIDWSFLKRTNVVFAIFAAVSIVLFVLLILGKATNGAKSWLHFGIVSFEPIDLAELILVILLAKYFSRRHIEIAHIRHVIVSGIYALVLAVLVALQPDFGGAVIIAFLWLGMVFVSGVSKKHIAILLTIAVVLFVGLWNFGFAQYQKNRILTFLHPLADIRGAGYNAHQAMIAVGSGELLGKGVGYGTQSRLNFLPEYQTDFIFAAFAEEWGFVGIVLFFVVFGVLLWRIIANAYGGATNFEILYGLGLAILLTAHFFVNVGMNMGILPVTGITLPFVSYGGSHLIVSFFALGVLVSMRKYMRAAHRESAGHEIIGLN
ncbi:MAG TPA: FtsW/RodA/SpoVE family cell cycle protein, partial [Candidatus Paceibacterota bacterium]|nr:FtsW/RodA/SpoVE family cell cycle protein [Candidatus Paceibacterota bacterium]